MTARAKREPGTYPWLERDRSGRERVPAREIRDFVRRVAERFKPLRIVLFGSYARGDFTGDSDVDIFVVKRKGGPRTSSLLIRLYVECPFPLDAIAIDETRLLQRLALNDSFLLGIVAEGKVLYEADDSRMGEEGGSRLSHRVRARGKPSAARL